MDDKVDCNHRNFAGDRSRSPAASRASSLPPTQRLRRVASPQAVPASEPAPLSIAGEGSSCSAGSSSTRPAAVLYPLLGREQECAELDRFFEACFGDPGTRGGCLYVSGGPGTGKTCSMRLAAKAWQEKHPDTHILEVNCMELRQRSVAGLLQHLAQLPPRSSSAGVARSGPAGGVSSRAAGPREGGACNTEPQAHRTGCSGRSGQGLLAAAAAGLAGLAPRVALLVDEVDQLVRRQPTQTAGRLASGGTLETLLSLPRLPGASSIALVAVANAVDLLERSAMPVAPGLCRSLLFRPYSAEQLRHIVRARLAAAGSAGEAAQQALGAVAIELRVRQVAKRSGDCRQVVCLCEQALFEASMAREATAAPEAPTAETPASAAAGAPRAAAPPAREAWGSPPAGGSRASGVGSPVRAPVGDAVAPPLTPVKRPAPGKDPSSNDPLGAIQQLPMEQQVLLCALASSKGEAVRFADLCSRYKEMCHRLHQRDNLASKQQVGNALQALEQRGLLGFRAKKGGGRGRTGGHLSSSDCVVELAMSCAAVRERISRANPLLQQCLE